MKSMKAKLITALLIASMLPGLLKAQTADEGVIQTTDNQTEWTTGQIKTPWVRWAFEDLPLSIMYSSANNATADGIWRNYDVSDNLLPFDIGVDANGCSTWNNLDSTIAEQPIIIKYMLADTAFARHGVGAKIDRKIDRYDVEVGINYTDTLTGQPEYISFRIPNHLYKYIMNLDTSAQTPFRQGHGFSLDYNPDSLDMTLENLYDVMVNPDLVQSKENQAQMNETSPYTGAGDAINSTLEMISEDGIENPFNPATISFTMKDYGKKKSGFISSENTEGPKPPDVDEADLESMVLKTANGNVTVKYLMPDTTVTYPGANVINIYEITVDSGFMPELQVYGLPATITMDQLNDTVYDVAVALQTPEGSKSATFDISVDFNAVPVGTPEIPAKPDYGAVNFPNPFRDNTTLRYTLKDQGAVKISLYDMNGKQVENVFEGQQVAGTHEFSINGSNYSSGLYFLKIAGEEGVQTLKFLKRGEN